MVSSLALASAPGTGYRQTCTCKRNPSSDETNTLRFKFDKNLFSSTLVLPKLSTRDWISCGRTGTSSCIINRAVQNLKWVRSFIIPWNWVSLGISIYLLGLNFASEAHSIPHSSAAYTCQNVQNYYAGAENLRGNALKQKLYSIISRHQTLSYKKVWDALQILDAADVDKPEASSEILEIYSLKVVSKHLAGKPQGWNREHLWPRSYGLTNASSFTDLHNIHPADVNVNSSRGNKFFGECDHNSSACLKPASNEAASDTETDKKRWAPPIKVRGDIARAIMYMAVCYGFDQSHGGPNLQLSDTPSPGTSKTP